MGFFKSKVVFVLMQCVCLKKIKKKKTVGPIGAGADNYSGVFLLYNITE